MTTYQLVDSKTQQLIGTYTKRATAQRRADKLDNHYGAVRYIVKPVFEGVSRQNEAASTMSNYKFEFVTDHNTIESFERVCNGLAHAISLADQWLAWRPYNGYQITDIANNGNVARLNW